MPNPAPQLVQKLWNYCNILLGARRLSVVEELESVVTANLQRATRLRQSILQNAFTGNL
jgi:type I restriction enzyme S subunit